MTSFRETHAQCGRVLTHSFVAIMLASASAEAATHCAQDTVQLQAALNAAGIGGNASGEDNMIKVGAGTFTVAVAPFTFYSASGHSLIIDGGYDGTCTTQDLTPETTKLDGNNAYEVLSIQTNGTVMLGHLTIQHGFRDGSSNGGGAGITLNHVQAADPVPTAIIDSSIFRSNASNYATGGLGVSATAPMGSTPVGIVSVENSLFVGNTAPSAAALFVNLGPGSTAYLINNTITGNVNDGGANATTAIGAPSGALTGYVTNTISYGNTSLDDFSLYFNDSVQFTNSDYGSVEGTPAASSSGNLIGVDPQFVGVGDYHLKATSPLLRAGTLSPPGGLAATDLDGNPRSLGGHVDLGAYENVDAIFADGFETH